MATFNPRTLNRLAARCINENIRCYKYLNELPVPTVCRDTCKKFYLTDNLNCDEKMPPYTADHYPYDHGEPHIQLDVDEYLSLMRFNEDDRLWFVYDRNHIHRHWYELDYNNEPLCFYCAHRISKMESMRGKVIYKMSSCFAVGSSNALPSIQEMDMWCVNCTTTSLFCIDEYAFTVEAHFPENFTREVDYAYRIK